jgi:putative aminopeptidase FrvX
MSHPDIYGMQTAISYQVVNSREGLEEAFGIPVKSFAYPYGQTNASITTAVEGEYSSAVGLGQSTTHSQTDLYNLTRIDVRSDMDMTSFQNALPW